MSGFYDDMAGTARELLAEFGQTVEIHRSPECPVDPITQEEDCTGLEAETFRPSGVLTSYPRRLVDGTTILQSDRRLILDDTVAPRMDDKPQIGGEAWTVVDFDAVNPAGTPVVYFVQVRK